MNKATKIPEKKKQIVKQLSQLVKDYPIVGIVNMENLPAKQLQNMKDQLRDTVEIIMTKQRMIKIILENCDADKKDIKITYSVLQEFYPNWEDYRKRAGA